MFVATLDVTEHEMREREVLIRQPQLKEFRFFPSSLG